MKRFLILLIVGLGVAPLFGQNVLTPELLWKIGRVSDPQVSPSGNQVLFGVTYYNLTANKGNRDLYVMDLQAGKSKKSPPVAKVTQITKTESGEYNARWTDKGRIAFLSSESGSSQVWEISADGSGKTQVTNFPMGVNDFELPSKGLMLFSSDVKMDQTVNELYSDLPMADARIIDDLMYRHWKSWHDFSYTHVFSHPYGQFKMPDETHYTDLMKGEKHDSPVPPFGGSEQYTASPDGKTILYCAKKTEDKVEWAQSTNSDIYAYDVASGLTRNLTKGMMGYDMEPVYSPDGRYIAWLSMERNGYESDRNRIMILDMVAQNSRPFEITAGFPHPAGHIHWTEDGSSMYFTAPNNGTYQVFKAKVSEIPGASDIKQVTSGVFNMNSAAEVLGGKYLISSRNSMSYPAELFLVNPETNEQVNVSKINDDLLGNVNWGNVTERTVKTSDGKDMLTWVITPPNFDPNKKYPTLLYCQGGPQSMVSQFFSYRWNFQLMAANGYVIVAPNRRGLPGFGEKWNEDISQDWGGQPMRDYFSAIDDVAEEPWADENKLGAVGASYGGYSVYYLAGIHNKRFKTFISHCGLFNLESWYGATEETFFANFDIGGPYWEMPYVDSYHKYSPNKFVQNWDTPILVIHGEKDFRVPVNQGMEAFNAAKLRGVPARFLYFPGEGHWVQSPQNGVLWHRVFFEWLDKDLK